MAVSAEMRTKQCLLISAVNWIIIRMSSVPIMPMSIPAVSIIAAKRNMAAMVIMSKTKGRFLVKTPFEIEMD